MLNVELRRVFGESEFESQRGDAPPHEAELIGADEYVAIRQGIRRHGEALSRGHGARVGAERALLLARCEHLGQLPQRQRHVEVQIGHDARHGHRWALREVVRSEQTLFFGRDHDEQD